MKNLNIYIKEGLVDWGDDEALNNKLKKTSTKAAVKKEIKQWIKENASPTYISKVKINMDSHPITVDTECDIWVHSGELTNGLFEWGVIDGDFRARIDNELKGLPKEITRGCYIDCGKNIKSLEGLPEKIYELRLDCNVRTFEGCPKEINTIGIYSPSLVSLKGCPDLERLELYKCSNLKSLKGCPKNIDHLGIERCPIENLEGCPKEMKSISITNSELKSLKGVPEKLENLSLGFSNGITKIDYWPKELKVFNAAGCDSLNDMGDFNPKGLEVCKFRDTNKINFDNVGENVFKIVKHAVIHTWLSKNFHLSNYEINDNIITADTLKCRAFTDHEISFDYDGKIKWDITNVYIPQRTNIKSLKGLPEKISGDLEIGWQEYLQSLEGAPKKIGGNLSFHNLKSYKGMPEEVGGDVILWNVDMDSYKELPKKIGGNLKLGYSERNDIKQIDDRVKGEIIDRNGNPIKF